MMSCEDIKEELEAFLGNEIDKPRRNEIQNHLDKCQNCSGVLLQLTSLSEVLQTWKEIEPSPLMYEKLKARLKATESSWRRIFTYSFARKAALRFAKVAAIVVLTLLISHLLQKPAPTPNVHADLSNISFYLKEHREAVLQAVSTELPVQPEERVHVGRDDILYYEFLDDFSRFSRPGLILRGPISQREISLSKTPTISKSRILTIPQAQNAVDFDPMVPMQLSSGYILDSIRKIDDYNSLHVLYTKGKDTISLFEQPASGKGGLTAQDFREYAVYSKVEPDAGTEGQGRWTILAWSSGTLSFVLIGKEDMSQLMDIVQSVSSPKKKITNSTNNL
jgi:hypothetical protein